MKVSRSRILVFVLVFVLILASSLPALQMALGSSQAAAWPEVHFLPLMMNDHLPGPTATPTRIPTTTATKPIETPPNPCATPPETLTAIATPTDTPTASATPTDTPTASATPTESPTPSATPICHLPSPTPTCSPTSTLPCIPTPIHTPIFPPTGTYISALKLTVTQSPLTIYPPVMIYTAQLTVMIPIPSTGVKVDFYNLQETGLEYLGSAEMGNLGQAMLSKQMCPGTYTAIARAVINSLEIWSNPVPYTVH
jgi:hypothetical protein